MTIHPSSSKKSLHTAAHDDDSPSRVGVPGRHYLLWGLAVATAGVGLGFIAPTVIGGVNALLDRTPFGAPGVLELIGRLSPGWSLAVFSILGVLAGIALALVMADESLSVTVTDDHVELDGGKKPLHLPRQRIGSAHLDSGRLDSHLEILGGDGRRLARRNADGLPRHALRAAFAAHQIPFHDSDPYENHYRRWVDGHPDLDDTTHELLRRRSRALEASEPARAEELFDALQDRGIVVRDQGGQQHVRSITSDARTRTTVQKRGTDGQAD